MIFITLIILNFDQFNFREIGIPIDLKKLEMIRLASSNRIISTIDKIETDAWV